MEPATRSRGARRERPLWLRHHPLTYELVCSCLKGGRLLELGCGEGHLLGDLSHRFDVCGIDMSQAAVEACSRRVGQGRVSRADIETADLAGPWDVVLAVNVMEHMNSPGAVVRRVAAALKPGGWFVFSVPNKRGLAGRAATALMGFWDRTHFSALPPDEWLSLLENAELVVEREVFPTFLGYFQARWLRGISSNVYFVARRPA